ncbi:efflux transporter outer membrane subunit [Solimonas marina]|uniref:Efflux transporter outer membrane subunit n=1 Tax=Solimonas marina TaxID=2714601 RepID=A0A970B6N3_9GAMM|nr:efflux transporter outer membrane subunit [Solimonas marina]NKF22775.1 efflux transporter outer membrane subunit [Solimonas marina]
MKTSISKTAVAAAAAALTLAMAGCAVGPDYKTPAPDQATTYTAGELAKKTVATPVAGGEAQTLEFGAEIPAQWWSLFGSDLISKRIDQAFAHSPTLASAQASLRQAQENVKAANGGYWPSFDLNGQASRQKINTATQGGANGGYIYNLFGASVGVSYTFDIFGAVRRSIEAQTAAADYQQYEAEATYLTLAANVVTASVREASLQTQVAATEDIVKSLEEQQRITEKQYQLGAVAMTDVLSARTQLEGTRASLPGLRQQLSETRNQLAVYLGVLPSDFDDASLDLSKLTLPQQIPLSVPSKLAQQRPDIRAAEALLHQASANVGVATANQLPSLTISGSYGSQATKSGDLFDGSTEVWSIAGGLTAPLFHGGELRARKRAAVAAYDQAAADYRQTVLQAFADVANSLHALGNDAQALQSRYAALQSADQNLDLVQRSYRAGAVGYLNVLDAQRQQQQAKIDFITAQAARYTDTAALFQALGGGWWNPQNDGAAPTATAVSSAQ